MTGLEKDVHLGVLERVPENTPTTWWSRMCVVPKKNASHHMVNFKAVNSAAARQTHPVIPPFLQVAGVSGGVYKTCLDAWKVTIAYPLLRRTGIL